MSLRFAKKKYLRSYKLDRTNITTFVFLTTTNY